MNYSSPGSSVLWILQARIPEWVAIPFSSQGSLPDPRIEPGCPALQAELSGMGPRTPQRREDSSFFFLFTHCHAAHFNTSQVSLGFNTVKGKWRVDWYTRGIPGILSLVYQRKKWQILTFVLAIQLLGWPRFHWLIDASMYFSFLPASPSLALLLFFFIYLYWILSYIEM